MFWRGGGRELLRGLLERGNYCPAPPPHPPPPLECQVCKPVFGVVAEGVSYLLRVKSAPCSSTGQLYSHDEGKIWPLSMDGLRCSHYSRGFDRAARRQGIQGEAELA